MEVTNINSTTPVNVAPVVRRPVETSTDSGNDSVEISPGALSAARLVDAVKSAPEVRPAAVQRLKSAVASGNYPPPAIIEGLARLIGATVKPSNE